MTAVFVEERKSRDWLAGHPHFSPEDFAKNEGRMVMPWPHLKADFASADTVQTYRVRIPVSSDEVSFNFGTLVGGEVAHRDLVPTNLLLPTAGLDFIKVVKTLSESDLSAQTALAAPAPSTAEISADVDRIFRERARSFWDEEVFEKFANALEEQIALFGLQAWRAILDVALGSANKTIASDAITIAGSVASISSSPEVRETVAELLRSSQIPLRSAAVSIAVESNNPTYGELLRSAWTEESVPQLKHEIEQALLLIPDGAA